MFNYRECIEKGLIRKTTPSKDKAIRSLKSSHIWLKEAEKNYSNNALRSSLLSAYLAVFHAARSILFFDGYREKSHACLARYLEENYVKKGFLELKWVEMLDHFRELRHSDQYSFNFFPSEEEIKEAMEKSKKFVERMDMLLQQKLRDV